MRLDPPALLVYILAAHILCAIPAGAQAPPTTFSDDFNTTEYFSTLGATVVADTVQGIVRLPDYAASVVGSVATPGSSHNIWIAGGVAYVADFSGGLQILDISDPTVPTPLGSITTSGTVRQVQVRGGKAFVVDTVGLNVIDVRDPAAPTLLGSIGTPGNARAVEVAGAFAYIADQSAGIQVIDISDPAAMAIVGSVSTPGTPRNLDLEGDLLYVMDGVGLTILDVSTPTAPVSVGAYATPGDAWSVDVEGNLAYLGDTVEGLHIVDVSTPASPVLVGDLNPGGTWRRLDVTGDYLYAATVDGVRIVDVSDPAHPVQLQALALPGTASDVEVDGQYLFVADGSVGGVQVVSIAQPMSPGVRSALNILGPVEDIEVAGNVAFLIGNQRDLTAVDVTDPSNPALLATHYPGAGTGTAVDLALSGRLAYTALGAAGMVIVDVGSATSMFDVGSYLAADAKAVATDGDVAYVGTEGDVHILDVTDPANPSLLSVYPTGCTNRGLVIDGDRLYVVNPLTGLHIVDVSDPHLPTTLGSFPTSGSAVQVSVDGAYAYLADTVDDLIVLDVSDPANPTQVGSWSGSLNPPSSVRHTDNHLVMTAGSSIRVFDVSTPATPVEVGNLYYSVLSFWVAGEILGDNIFIADRATGLRVMWGFQRQIGQDVGYFHWLPVLGTTHPLVLTRMSTLQTDYVYLQPPGYASAQPLDTWLPINTTELQWMVFLERYPNQPPPGPTVDRIDLDLRYDVPVLEHVRDVANDQGGQVRVTWTRSGYDISGSAEPIQGYAVYREIDPALGGSGGGATGFDYLVTVPARGEDTYAVVVPTLADSTVTGGLYESRFYVRALTASPAVHFDSEVVAGYSVDNLVPGPPGGATVAYATGSGNTLDWTAPGDPDVSGYRVYSGASPDFEVGAASLVAQTTATSWIDPDHDSGSVFYRISAVDASGNESPAVAPVAASPVPGGGPPLRNALDSISPNPFNPATTIAYTVAEGETTVRLDIFDVSGRHVRTLVDGMQPARRYRVTWDGRDDTGKRVPSGAYFCRLQAGATEQARKMLLVK